MFLSLIATLLVRSSLDLRWASAVVAKIMGCGLLEDVSLVVPLVVLLVLRWRCCGGGEPLTFGCLLVFLA